MIAFSTFNQTPPDNAIFGKPPGVLSQAFNQPESPNLQVLCTNPAALRGGSAPLDTLVPTAPFPGTIGLGVQILYNGTPPTAPTPWVTPQDHFTGACVQSPNGTNVLIISPVDGARTLTPSPDPTWGLHLADGEHRARQPRRRRRRRDEGLPEAAGAGEAARPVGVRSL